MNFSYSWIILNKLITFGFTGANIDKNFQTRAQNCQKNTKRHVICDDLVKTRSNNTPILVQLHKILEESRDKTFFLFPQNTNWEKRNGTKKIEDAGNKWSFYPLVID